MSFLAAWNRIEFSSFSLSPISFKSSETGSLFFFAYISVRNLFIRSSNFMYDSFRITRLPTRFSPRSWSAVSSAWKFEISKSSPNDFMMSSSIEPDVVTRMFGIWSLQSWANKPRRPDVTIFDVNVRKTFDLSRFIFRTTFAASFNSIDW